MSNRKLAKWVNDNLVMIVGIPLIIGVHYGWSKLQDVPSLVDPAEKRDIPIIAAYKSIKNRMVETFFLGESKPESED